MSALALPWELDAGFRRSGLMLVVKLRGRSNPMTNWHPKMPKVPADWACWWGKLRGMAGA
jgi:hypothetical protein